MPCVKKLTRIMENKRFFAYGCSFTNYAWPTWADLIGGNFDEYFNYGAGGAGNFYIFNSLMETDQTHKITKDDLVIIQWSCSSREDRYKDNKWLNQGGVANYYTRSEMIKFFDFRGFVIRDAALIKAAKIFLDNIGCEYYFLSMVPLTTNNMYKELFNTDTTDVGQLYKDILDTIKPSFEEVIGSSYEIRPITLHGKKITDSHPIPSEHYDYISKVLPNKLLPSRSVVETLDLELANVYTDNEDYSKWTHMFKSKQHNKTKNMKRL